MAEIVDENGKIDYNLALDNLKAFLYGRRGKINTHLRFSDLRFYRRNFRLVLRALSLPLVVKVMSLWQTLGYKVLRRYFQLNVIGVINKLKERDTERRNLHEK